jgi:hypothetical protein
MEEGTSAIDKRNQDEGGRREGVRVLHTAHEQNKATRKLPWCQCDGPMVGALKAVELRRTYEQRGSDRGSCVVDKLLAYVGLPIRTYYLEHKWYWARCDAL